jgi:LysM repeat protein
MRKKKMKTYKRLIIVCLLIMAITLTGCERLASKAPTEMNVTQVLIIPTPTSNPAQIMIAQTQTVAAGEQPSSTPTTAVSAEANQTSTVAVNIIVTVTPTPIPSPAATQVQIPTLARPITYTLQKNEDPFCVARRFNIDIGEVLSLNNLTTDSKPAEGTTLKIPNSGHFWSSGARMLVQHPASYTVRSGETIYQIACQYGDVSPEAIIAVNGLQEPYTLTAGQILSIP